MAKTVSDLTHTGQVNSFTGGLNTDLHPLVQPNDTLTDCINGTLITYNGNENMLQNDMGNYTLKGSELPDGFIPLGMKEHNGVAYIVSHNPMTKEVQIGSYPSPKLTTDENGKKLESTPIQMNAVDNKNYTYKSCSDALCLEAQKFAETDYVDFDITINFGDVYELSKMDENTDFQQEQFSILEDSGKITNIYPIVDNKLHSVDWTSSGKLLKKYILNKVTNFQQEVNWTLPEPPIQSRVVGGDDTVLTPDDEYIYPKPDLQSITIKNTLSFNRIDVNWEDTSEVYVGVVYEIVTGNPKLFHLESSWSKCTKTHKEYTLKKWDKNSTTFDFEYTLDSTNKDVVDLYFLRIWRKINSSNENELPKIVGEYGAPIQIHSYPILIHRVNGEDRSVVLFNNSEQESTITELDAYGGLKYQYYCTPKDENYQVTIILPDVANLIVDPEDDTKKSLKAPIFYLQSDGSLCTAKQAGGNKQETLTFAWKNSTGSGELKSTDSVVFIQVMILNQSYCLPIFTKVDENMYNKYKLYYPNFCLIPGDQLLEFDEVEYVESGETSTKFINLQKNKFTIYDEPFNTSVYLKDNNNSQYGDVGVGILTVNNIISDKINVALQTLNSNDEWETISSKSYIANNSKVEIKDAIIYANVQQAIGGDDVQNCVERIYLAKHGHAPFAFSDSNEQRNDESWKKRFLENTKFNENEFKKLKKYANWGVDNVSLYVGKHCGATNNAFIIQTCDHFGNLNKDIPQKTCSTELEWSTNFNNLKQLFVPMKMEIDCLSSNISYPTQWKPEYGYLNVHKTGRGKYITFLTRTVNTPHLPSHISLIPENYGESDIVEFEKWLLYLYTHVFYYDQTSVSAQSFELITAGNNTTFRYNIAGTFGRVININGKPYKFNADILNNLLGAINCKCNNFNYSTKNNIDFDILQVDTNEQWEYINNIVESIKSDDSMIQNLTVDGTPKWKNTLFFDDNDSVIAWQNLNVSNDNIARCMKMWYKFDLDNTTNSSTITYTPYTEPICAAVMCGGNSANPVTLANMSATRSGLHYQTDKLVLEAVEEYQLSPRFKQIINYGTEN